MQLASRLDVEKDSVWLLANKPAFEKELPFSVQEIGRFTAKPTYCARHVDRNGYLLLYTVAGEGVLRTGDKTHRLPQGSVVYFDRSKTHEFTPVGDVAWEFYWIHLEGVSCKFFYDTLFPKSFAPLQSANGVLQALFDDIMGLFENPAREAYVEISTAVSNILAEMTRIKKALGENDMPHMPAIQRTIQHIRENFDQPIEVGELADMAELSKYYYIKMFRDVMHTTPYEYLLQYRINESRKLLRGTGHKASEIAQMVGFADECNFSRTFKKFTGYTPLQYRKMAQ